MNNVTVFYDKQTFEFVTAVTKNAYEQLCVKIHLMQYID